MSSSVMKIKADARTSLCDITKYLVSYSFMWIYMDVRAIGLILYYEELYFNYSNRVSRPVPLCSLCSSLSFCLILVQAICYKHSSHNVA